MRIWAILRISLKSETSQERLKSEGVGQDLDHTRGQAGVERDDLGQETETEGEEDRGQGLSTEIAEDVDIELMYFTNTCNITNLFILVVAKLVLGKETPVYTRL